MDFSKIIDRRGTDSLKYDFALKRGMPEDILPLWVADMDFRAPSCVIDALFQKTSHGIFGYSETDTAYFEILKSWFSRNHNWEVKEDWLVKTPGVVFAICAAVRALTEKGDSILIQQPVYYPFSEAVNDNNRKLVVNELKYSDGVYTVDFDDFEDKIVRNNVKLFILCSPHNPVGRVWTEDELIRMGDICLKHKVIVVSDEIHMDFTYHDYRHRVFADLKPEYESMTITCTAPTKTFNVAGLQISNIFISDSDIRALFKKELDRAGYSQANIMGIAACKAAYSEGEEWLNSLRAYLADNLKFLREFIKERIPRIKLVEPEGTYLVWLDFKGLGLDEKGLNGLIIEEAGLWLDRGTMFGQGGANFQRLNIACPQLVLGEALTKLEKAINDINTAQ